MRVTLQNNGVEVPTADEDNIPLPCSTLDVREVESVTKPGYIYLIRPISLHERVRMEARLNRFAPRMNRTRELVAVLRKHEDDLHKKVGKPVLFEQFIQMGEAGTRATHIDIPQQEEEEAARLMQSGENPQRLREIEEKLEESRRINPIAEAQIEYENEARRLDERFSELTEDRDLAQSQYMIALVEGMLWGVDDGQGNRRTDLTPEQRARVVGAMADSRDLNKVWDAAFDLYNLRENVKKNSD
jgi:hypothetical protein